MSTQNGFTINSNALFEQIDLSSIIEINNINLNQNPLLSKLNFDSLVKILNGFSIRENFNLANISLPSLEELNGSLSAYESTSNFKTLNFPELRTLKGQLDINEQASLEMLSLPKLEIIEGNSLTVNGCSSIKTLNFPNLTTITQGAISINDNSVLSEVSFLKLLKVKTTGIIDIGIRDNLKLTSVSFNSLKNLEGGGVWIQNTLQRILESVGNLPVLTISFPELESLTQILIENLNLLDLEQLRIVEESLSISNTKSLSKVTLPMLKLIDNLFIENNINLQSIDLTSVVTAEYFVISSNDNLTKLNLDLIEKIDTINIKDNPLLIEISLPNVQEITTSFNIDSTSQNNSNIEIIRLPSLSQVEMISVRTNGTSDKLIEIFEITNLIDFEKIIIHDGVKLSTKAIDQLLERLVSIIPPITRKEILIEGDASSSGFENENILEQQGNNIKVY